MPSSDLMDDLHEADILKSSSDENEVLLSETFLEAVENRRADIETRATSEGAIETWLEDQLNERRETAILAEIGAEDPEFLAHYCAVADLTSALAHEEITRIAIVLLQFDDTKPPADGTPEPFLAVRGETLPTIVRLTERGVVYIWRHECEPCDLMKERLEAIFDEQPSDISLFSVYGPDNAELLHDTFDVVGAPTTLFVLDGRVDTRLHSSHPQEIIESEIENLRELS